MENSIAFLLDEPSQQTINNLEPKSLHSLLQVSVEHHQMLYYENDDPIISDEAFDRLFRCLLMIESKYPEFSVASSPAQVVGGKASGRFPAVAHKMPMLSLENSMNRDEAMKFLAETARELGIPPASVEYVSEPKYDGLSISNRFEYGHLKCGATRGDGVIGENVTPNVLAIDNIPHFIPQLASIAVFEVRGEILMSKEVFLKLNETRLACGNKLFVNPRNAASGSLRQLDSNITKGRHLQFFAYSLGECSGYPFSKPTTQYEVLAQLKSMGFAVSNEVKTVMAKDVQSHFDYMTSIRHSLPFEVDGVVFKVNKLQLQEELGRRTRTPNWATAYKFLPEEVEAELLAIEIQVGRTGALTPVARISPVKVGGVTVSNVTLHNKDEIERLDVRVGDTVVVYRGGDVIPAIRKVVFEKRKDNALPFLMPSSCPSCASSVISEPGKAIVYCSGGLLCSDQKLGMISHFASKSAMNIDGLADGKITALLESGKINMTSDLFNLMVDDVRQIEGFAEKSAENLIRSIQTARNPTLAKFLFALGIPTVGISTAKNLASKFKSFDGIINADIDNLKSVDDVGSITAEAILDYFKKPANLSEASKFKELLKIQLPEQANSTVFDGMTFVVTGTMSVPRLEIQKLIEDNGGKVSASVSKKTNYVVAGESAGTKEDKAKELGITILTEGQLRQLLPGVRGVPSP